VLLGSLLLGGMAVAPRFVAAAELRLRAESTASGPVVKLGDLAEIIAADPRQAETLSAIELFPAPAAREQRFVRLREIQDLLLLRGVNLAEHQFSGSSQVTVSGSQPARSQPLPSVSVATSRRIQRRLGEAIAKYLDEQGSQQPWSVEAELSDEQAHWLADPTQKISVAGGHAPWTGRQRFAITVRQPKGPAQFEVEVQVRVPALVVVASRSLARGAIVRDGDVEIQRDTSPDNSVPALQRVEEVLGREVARAIPVGKTVTNDELRSPLMVHRGEVVTVYANNAGIRIRTAARARDEGSQGDLVAIESLLDHSTYYARISGVRQVEVYGQPARADRADSETPESPIRR
jgi:flagella basal body P-ring formation protein FlgA